MKKVLIFVGVIVFIFLTLISACSSQNYVEIKGERIVVEIAKSLEERSQGLMNRENLCETCGMLFIFPEKNKHTFWMKNTLIPLDMVFINSNLEIVDVLHAQACVSEVCETYTPRANALYVLEVNEGKYANSLIGEKISMNIKN